MFPKFPYWRSTEYRKWVATLPCIACGVEGFTQVAHSNQAKHGTGRSIKASDEYTFPLCCPRVFSLGCHVEHDACLDMSKDERDALEDEYIAKTWARAEAEGWHEVRARA